MRVAPSAVPSSLGYQVVLRLEVDAVMAPSPVERRALAQAIFAAAREVPLVGFGVADTHLHAIVLGPRAAAVEVARRLSLAWWHARPRRPRLAPPTFRPVHDQWHLGSALPYVLRQAARHEVSSDAHRDGSMVLDLAGLRVIAPGAVAQAREFAPRLSARDLAHLLGAPELEAFVAHPRSAAPVGEAQATLLAAAAEAALGLPHLRGRHPRTIAARAAAIHAVAATVEDTALARALGVSRRALLRARAWPTSAEAVAAVRGQVAFRELVLQGPAVVATGVERPAEDWEEAEAARRVAAERERAGRRASAPGAARADAPAPPRLARGAPDPPRRP